jgi:DNA-3-methyladenine glycosylase II
MSGARILSKRIVRDAVAHLRSADAIMCRLIDAHPFCSLADREYRPFHTLAASIISQQLSAKAADTIESRVAALTPAPFEAESFLAVPVEALRAAGLSQAKARYIRELAERVCDGRLNFDALPKLDDEKTVEILCELPGIGRWTAEMFLIFGLRRPNVLSVGDAGLQRAARLLYGSKSKTEPLLERVAGPWNPYRSVASWYLWRHLDGS